MGGLSPWHLIIFAVIALVVFARPGKLSGLMGDAGKGIKAFKDGLKDDEAKTAIQQGTLPHKDAEKEEAKNA